MQRIVCTGVTLLSILLCHAQGVRFSRTLYFYPSWDTSLFRAVKMHAVVNDSIYYYAKAQKKHDSALAAVLYFNTRGYMIEKDEFEVSSGGVEKITNYTYNDNGTPARIETQARSSISINGNPAIDKDVVTFDYDTAGNIIARKDYSYIRDTSGSLTENNYEYDSAGRRIKEYLSMPHTAKYLYRDYTYTGSKLSEEKMFDFQGHWMYSYDYEYDDRARETSIYLVNDNRTLSKEYFYDTQQRLIKEKSYSNRNVFWDHSTQEYTYSSAGLLTSQSYRNANGDNFYFRHFYTIKKM
ncbi:MAG TPA: hypothetical protein VHB48_11540 [Chitinophagaceae bacterium]|nr:hypothetical protein [Chitinophagaceae bacterium]